MLNAGDNIIDLNAFVVYTFIMRIENLENTQKIIESIFAQAQNGKVSIESSDLGSWTFYVKFYTKIAGQLSSDFDDNAPIVNIPNYENFVNLVDKYLLAAKKFYNADQEYFMLSDKGFEEKLFMDLFVNATNFDINNIEQFLALRTQMVMADVKNKIINFGKYQNYECECSISKNHSNLEGTHKFSIRFKDDDGGEFLMPAVTFSIVGNTAYMYAVQRQINHKSEGTKSVVEKKLDRYFRKINKDVPVEFQNISPNALVSLIIFGNYLKSLKITNVVAPDYMPIRYEAKATAISKNAKTVDEEIDMLEKHNQNQYNITNKFMDLFVRYNLHFQNSIIDYDSNMQMMTMKLSENNSGKFDDNVAYEIEQICAPQTNKKQNMAEISL